MNTISFSISTEKGEIKIRTANRSDIEELIELNKLCFPSMAEEDVVWHDVHLQSHQRVFPDGQLVAEMEDGTLVGGVSTLIVNMGSDPLRPHTYAGITDGGFFHNHDPHGDTLYGADVYVHPTYRGLRIGAALYEGRRRLCKNLNLRRILAGGRLWNYQDHWDEMSPEEYAKKVENGDLKDLVLSFQLREGFVLRGILHDYITDPNSKNNASLIEWMNPDYVPENKDGNRIRIASVQYQVRKINSFTEFADQVHYFAETAADYRADFILFPEFFSVQLLSMEKIDALSSLEGIRRISNYTDAFTELMSGISKKWGFHVIAGSHPIEDENGKLLNTSMVFSPDGTWVGQPKLHITPSERKYWGIDGGNDLHIFQSPKAKFGVQICYDIEFPEASRYLADNGADIIFVPYCTDNRQGHLRVKYCAQARAVENQVYVVTSGIIGNLPSVPAMDIHYGQAAIFSPSDFEFPKDGIVGMTDSNVETILISDIDLDNLYRTRHTGSVQPRRDRRPDLFEFKTKFSNQKKYLQGDSVPISIKRSHGPH
jgi:predicted amidohydrolase/GNAT superfamily N-acetyltransferase